ncbi:hypothetical protein PCE1_001150 [Barthelona sp. PCE]
MIHKVDQRIFQLITRCCAPSINQRSMFVILGKYAREQVHQLHHFLSTASKEPRRDILWCYDRNLGFHTSNRRKNVRKRRQKGLVERGSSDPFELFRASNNIRYCYYNETEKVLGRTFDVLILSEFHAITPNSLARTIETVRGGGMIIFLLDTIDDLQSMGSIKMSVHKNYRHDVYSLTPRFNMRFMRSLVQCSNCFVVDDKLSILPDWRHRVIQEVTTTAEDIIRPELVAFHESIRETEELGKGEISLAVLGRTMDQTKTILKLTDYLQESNIRRTAVITAGRGRGKSAALGLATSLALHREYSVVNVTAPSLTNLITFFEFVKVGLERLGYLETTHFDVVYERSAMEVGISGIEQERSLEASEALIKSIVLRKEHHRSILTYITPQEISLQKTSDLLVIDEAAAIPLDTVRSMFEGNMGMVFMSSTVVGYEGTGRSLSLKLVEKMKNPKRRSPFFGRPLMTIEMKDPIRYGTNDAVERWLHSVLCLDTTNGKEKPESLPNAESCLLYEINRDTLFSGKKSAEAFLKKCWNILVSSHYRNSPNDLQLLSDSPTQRLFALMAPMQPGVAELPTIICVIQVSIEGRIQQKDVHNRLAHGEQAAGDMIPWMISSQFTAYDFPELLGARVIRIATHPNYQGKGYGSRALSLYQEFYNRQLMDEGKIAAFSEAVEKRRSKKKLLPLLLPCDSIEPMRLHWLGVSYGLTQHLLKFWKKHGYEPFYVSQKLSVTTGEFSCMMIRPVDDSQPEWFTRFTADFRCRFKRLLGYSFRSINPQIVPPMLLRPGFKADIDLYTKAELDKVMTPQDQERLELYTKRMVDYHMIMDLLPILGDLWFYRHLDVSFSALQTVIFCGMAFQHHNVNDMCKFLKIEPERLIAIFLKIIHRVHNSMDDLIKAHYDKEAPAMEPVNNEMDDELQQHLNDMAKRNIGTVENDGLLSVKRVIAPGSVTVDQVVPGGTKDIIDSKKRRKSKRPNKKQKTHRKLE